MTTINEMFAAIEKDQTEEFEFNFTSENDLDNIDAMGHFLEESGFEDYVSEDDGTMVFLSHDEYDFRVVIESFGLGDFYTHGISAIKE